MTATTGTSPRLQVSGTTLEGRGCPLVNLET